MTVARDLLAPNGLDYAIRRCKADTTAQPNEFVAVDTTAGAVTVTLRAGSDAGACIAVGDDGGNAATHAITVEPGDGTIDGAGSYAITTAGGVEQFIFDGAAWRRVMKTRRVADVAGRPIPVVYLEGLTAGASVPPGADKQIIFNDAGVLNGDPGLTFDKATGAATIGTGNVITPLQYPWVLGNSNTMIGPRSMVLGYNNIVRQTFSIAVGANNDSGGAASVALGESHVVTGSNAVAIGYACQVSNDYAVAIGVSCVASAVQSMALGTQSSAVLAGALAHASGVSHVQGRTGVDLGGQTAVAGAVTLALVGGAVLNVPVLSVCSMRVRVTGVSIGDSGAKRAVEVHELLVTQGPGGIVVVDSDHIVSQASGANAAVGFAQYGWSITIAKGAGASQLDITCNSGADAVVRFAARVEWLTTGNINTV